MSSETYRLQQELATLRSTNAAQADQLRHRDMAEFAKAEAAKPQINYALKHARQSVDQTLGNPQAVEELRAVAWIDYSHSTPGKFWHNRAPGDGSWPEGMSPEAYVRKFHGLNDDGAALAGEKPVEPEPTKLSPWLEAGIGRAKEGKS